MRRVWLVALLPLLAAAAWVVSSRAGAADGDPVVAQPMLGVADPSTVLMGAAGDTTWAYRVLPREAGPPAGADVRRDTSSRS